MRAAIAFAALAILLDAAGPAGGAPAQAVPQPKAPRSVNFPAQGDALDAWCKAVKAGALAAECGDRELRALAVERLFALDQALARLDPERQKALAADQDAWALSSPLQCGLQPDMLPSLPLDPWVRECMVAAGRERLAFLQAYGADPAREGVPPAAGAKGGR